MNEELIKTLKGLAEQRCWYDELYIDGKDVVVDDFAGGNVDDAFEGGMRSGEVSLARDILTALGIPFTIEEA